MKKNRFVSTAILAAVLAVVAACSGKNLEGSMHALFETLLDPSADRALLNATSAALKTTEAHFLAYTQAMTATGVKSATVDRAIAAYRASRQGGLEEQLESAYNTSIVLIDSGVADRISKAASDPGFQRSWSQVKPHFDKSQHYFNYAEKLHGYATTKFSVGAYFQGQNIKQGFSGNNQAAKFKSAVLGVKLLTQVINVVPKLLSNYEKLNKLDKQLKEIPSYAQAEKEREAAGGNLNQVQLTELNKEADQALQTGKPVFSSLFEEEPASQVASAGADPDDKLKQREYCRKVQTELKRMKLYNGKIDGLCGPGSRRAIRMFKRKNGLGIDGKWTVDAEKALFAG